MKLAPVAVSVLPADSLFGVILQGPCLEFWCLTCGSGATGRGAAGLTGCRAWQRSRPLQSKTMAANGRSRRNRRHPMSGRRASRQFSSSPRMGAPPCMELSPWHAVQQTIRLLPAGKRASNSDAKCSGKVTSGLEKSCHAGAGSVGSLLVPLARSGGRPGLAALTRCVHAPRLESEVFWYERLSSSTTSTAGAQCRPAD
jgi:hypothetical protein